MTMKTVVHFDPATGSIKGLWRAPADTLAAHPFDDILDHPDGGAQPDTHYVDVAARAVVERPRMALAVSKTALRADGHDSALVGGIPAGARVTSAMGAVTVDDGGIEFTTVLPGRNAVVVDHFPFVREDLVFDAT